MIHKSSNDASRFIYNVNGAPAQVTIVIKEGLKAAIHRSKSVQPADFLTGSSHIKQGAQHKDQTPFFLILGTMTSLVGPSFP